MRTDDPQPRRGRSRCLEAKPLPGGRNRCWSEALIAGGRTGASVGWRGVPPHPTGFAFSVAGQNGDALGLSGKDECTERLYA